MSWSVIVPRLADADMAEAATWYERKETGLGRQFIDEVERVFVQLGENPFLNSRRHRRRHIRWRYPSRFPYRIIYRIEEESRTVTIVSVLHAKRHDRHWRERL